MKFTIITHVLHKTDNDCIGGYAPYVREMNLWLRHVDSVRIVAPLESRPFNALDIAYEHPRLCVARVPSFNIVNFRNSLLTFIRLPLILFRIFLAMFWADHIHIRCPGNMGLLACLIQIFFPFKRKSVKYAGNWDPNSNQPISYRLQRWILNSPWLTRNTEVLVYGSWPDSSCNIVPFFTATYSETEIEPVAERPTDSTIRLIFVGALSSGKRPLLAIKVVKSLHEQGIKLTLDIYGDGAERLVIEKYLMENNIAHIVQLHGNVDAAEIKTALKKSNFLVFLSKSEGWPKVVAEAMFWGCVPVTTAVSCVPYMLGNGERGAVVAPDVDSVVTSIKSYLALPDRYAASARAAMTWSRLFTLENFESEIVKLLQRGSRSA